MDGNANKEILERKNHKHIPDSYSEVEVCKEKIANKHQRGKTTHTSLILILNLRVQVPKDGGRIALYEDLQVGRVGLLTQTRSTQECEEGPAGLHPIGPDPSTRKDDQILCYHLTLLVCQKCVCTWIVVICHITSKILPLEG